VNTPGALVPARTTGEWCLDDDEIDVPDAEPTGVNVPATIGAPDDGRTLSISAQERNISRTEAGIGSMTAKVYKRTPVSSSGNAWITTPQAAGGLVYKPMVNSG
jgi:hypothetical protein